ncbi:MAG: hypothetical protein [Circular genetic element sp.]|nr:MAG: hypothetical protein [Circular genetic element sp.]
MTLTDFLIDLILDWDEIPSYEHLANDEKDAVVYREPRPGRIVEPFVMPRPHFGSGTGRTKGGILFEGFASVVTGLSPVPTIPYWLIDQGRRLMPEETVY